MRTLLPNFRLTGRSPFVWLAFIALPLEGALPTLSVPEKAIIGEAYNLWSSRIDSIWPSASKINIPFVYVGEEWEYAIGFPAALNGFIDQGERLRERTVQVRARTLDRTLSASFPLDGSPAVVIGSPEALGKSAGEWVITAGHEMFHVYQAAMGSYEKTASLEIGPRDDSTWQLRFPFPYTDPEIMKLIHLQGYLLWLTSVNTNTAESRYQIGTAVEAAQMYKAGLAKGTSGEKAYRYSEFQEWNEGVAAYTEFRLAETAAHDKYAPTQAYASLAGFQSYQDLWRHTYEARPFLAKHAGRAAKSRTAFYHLGMGKALALDRVSPAWKEKYFIPGIWLDDILADAAGIAP
jgi:hypothetical protein